MESISNINIDGKVEDRIADELAKLALERTTDEQLTTMINNVIHDKFDAERKHTWGNDVNQSYKLILQKYYQKLGERITTILETEDKEKEIDETARRIIDNAREVSERYLTEAIAKRMCMMHTDFAGDWQKMDMTIFVNDVMNNHLQRDHMR